MLYIKLESLWNAIEGVGSIKGRRFFKDNIVNYV